MNLPSSLPVLLATGCSGEVGELYEIPDGFVSASDFKESPVERDQKIEAELRAQIARTFGKCEVAFEAFPSHTTHCPPIENSAPHVLLRTVGSFDANYNIGHWTFCEYKDSVRVDDVCVRSWCTDFVHSNGNPGWHPSDLSPDLDLDEALKKSLPPVRHIHHI